MSWEEEDVSPEHNSWTEYRLLVMKALERLEGEVRRKADELKRDIEVTEKNLDRKFNDLNIKVDRKTQELTDKLNDVKFDLSLKLQDLESNYTNQAKWAGAIVSAIVSIIVSVISGFIIVKLVGK